MSQDNGADRPKKDVALFLDFENVYISVRQVYGQNPNFEAIAEKADELGRVIISRAYADWYRYQRITNALYANGIEPVYVPTYYYGQNPQHANAIKNSVDIHLTIDAMRTLYTHNNIDIYMFVTGDRDFIPLMNAIRQYGKECVVVGVAEAASSHLAQSADQFFFYHQLVEEADGKESAVRDPYDGLIQATKLARERDTEPTFATIKLLMQEVMGSFDERRIKGKDNKNFTRFKDFVREAERRGLINVYSNGTVNQVLLPGEKARESTFAPLALPIGRDMSREEQGEDTIVTPVRRPQRAAPRPTAERPAVERPAADPAPPVRPAPSSRPAPAVPSATASRPARTPRSRPRIDERSREEAVSELEIAPSPPIVPAAPEPEPEPILDYATASPTALIMAAVRLARRRNNLCTAATLKVLIKELYPEFDEQQFQNTEAQPYAKFKDLLEDVAKTGKVQILTTGTVDEVFLEGEDPQKLSRFANRMKR